MNYKVGDKVVFETLMRDSAEDWMMNERQFNKVKSYLGRIGTISEIEKRYNDNETVSYYLTVQFISGFTLHRVNRLAFVPYEVNFDYI